MIMAVILPFKLYATPISTCTTINSPGYYELVSDLSSSSTCIQIRVSDVVLEGNGHLINGTDVSGSYGVYIYRNPSQTLTNITVKNLRVSNFDRGIYVRNTANVSIVNVTSFSHEVATYSSGIYVTSTQNLSLINVNASYSDYGVLFYINVANSTLKNITAVGNLRYGVWLRSNSGFNRLIGIKAISNNNGVRISGSSPNVTVENSSFVNNTVGLDTLAENTTLLSSYAENCTTGFYLTAANFSRVEDSTVKGKGTGTTGVYISGSHYTRVMNLSILQSYYGVQVYNSENLTFSRLTAEDTSYSIYAANTNHSILENSTLNNSIYYGVYLSGCRNFSTRSTLIRNVTGNAGWYASSSLNLTLVNTTFVEASVSGTNVNGSEIFNNSFTGGKGIYLQRSHNNTIRKNILRGIIYPIREYYSSSHNRIADNQIYQCSYGIYLFQSENTTVEGNTLTNITNFGVWVSASSYATIADNKIRKAGYGIYLQNSLYGSLEGNYIRDITPYYGIWLANSNFSNITSNIVINASYSIYFTTPASQNLVYNNFFNSTNNFLYSGTTYPNHWNISKTPGTNIVGGRNLGGNAWVKPTGDGFSQNCTDADGDDICDSPYVLAPTNVDYLPLKFTPRLKVRVNTSSSLYTTAQQAEITTRVTDYIGEPVIANVTTWVIKGNASQPWWNSSFRYRIPITVQERSGSTLTNYQITVTLNTLELISQGKLQPDCSDLRAAWLNSSNATEPLSYWVENCNSTATKIWVKIPELRAGENTTFFIYYGNTTPVQSESNGSAVFEFFDDFEVFTGWQNYSLGVVYQSNQQAYQGSYSIKKDSNNDPNGGYRLLGFTIGRGYALEGYTYRPSGYTGGPVDRIGLENLLFNGYTFAVNHRTNQVWIDRRTSGSPTLIGTSIPYNPPEDTWYFWRLSFWQNNTITFQIYLNNVLQTSVSATDASYTNFDRVVIHGGYQYFTDLLRLRKLASPEPRVFTGEEQRLIAENSSVTNSSGELIWKPSLWGLEEGYYSAVSLANKTSYISGYASKSFIVKTPILIVKVNTSKSKYYIGERVDIKTNVTEYYTSQPVENATVTAWVIKGNTSQPWWNSSFRYRIPITVQERSGSTLTNYQIAVTLNTRQLISQGKLQPDCSDLRAAWLNSSNATEPLSYWVENCNSTATRIWVKIPELRAGENTTFFIYYGNTTPVQSEADKYATFQGEHYVVSDTLAFSNLEVVAYANSTNVSDGISYMLLNEGETGTFPAAELSALTRVTANSSISGGFTYAGAGDALTPAVFGGRVFGFVARRGTNSIDIISPWADAEIRIYEGTTLRVVQNLPRGSWWEYTYNFADGSAVIVVSNASILVHHEDETNNYDFFPVYPASTELWGIPSAYSGYTCIACLMDNTLVRIYYSDGTNESQYCNRGDSICVTKTTQLTEGYNMSLHAVANGSIGGNAVADSDGTEGTVFLPEDALDTEYYLPQDAQYIAIAATQPYTNCTLNFSNSSGSFSETKQSGGLPRPYPNAIYFGSRTDGVHIYAGAHLVCDAPVFVYYEYAATNGETNLFGIRLNRKYAYPEPLVYNGSEQRLIAENSSLTDGNGSWIWWWESAGVQEGYYSAVSLMNKTGYHSGYSSRSFYLESLPVPLVSFIYPLDGSVIKGTTSINVSVADSNGVVSVYAYVKNTTFSRFYNLSLYQGSIYSGNWSNASFATATFEDGYYNITVNATNTLGYYNDSVSITVLIDNYIPEITFTAPTPTNGSVVDTPWVYINITINDAGDTAILEWNGTNYSMNRAGYKNFWLNLSLSGEYAGNYTYRVYVNDSAGNWNISEFRLVTVKGRLVVGQITSLAPAKLNRSSYNVTMLKFSLKALGENTTISSITIRKTGNFPYSQVNASLYWDKNGDTTTSYNTSIQADDEKLAGPQSFGSDNLLVFSGSPLLNLSAGENKTLVVYYDIL